MAETLQGLGVSGGVALGRALLLESAALPSMAGLVAPDAVEAEVARLREARTRVRAELVELKERLLSALGERYAGMIETHLLILDDPALVEEAETRIRRDRLSASWALKETVDGYVKRFATVDDVYFRERGGDLADVHRRLQQVLAGGAEPAVSAEGPVVVVAHSLGPADAVLLARLGVVGLATDLGGPTSHTAILARALGVPTVLGLHDVSRRVRAGDAVVVDADAGTVELRPGAVGIADAVQRRRAWEAREEAAATTGILPAVTRDGVEVVLRANVELPEEVEPALRVGAHGIGLYRSEFLLVDRSTFPDAEEQAKVYRELVRRVAPHPAVVRTFDLGEDKPFGASLLGGRRRPALGLRGVRFCLRHPEVFRPQLRGLLRAAADGDLRILIPLVTSAEEVREVRRLLADEARALAADHVPHRAGVPVGIMVEVPAAAMTADLLAREADFFSIGTNDLVQYTLAVGRNDDDVAELYDPRHTAVLRLVAEVVARAGAAGIPVGVCGEMASDPAQLPLLLGLGVRELSVQPRAIVALREAIRGMDAMDAAARVRALVAPGGRERGMDR